MVKNFEKLKKNFENAKIIYKKNNFKSFCVTITTNTSRDNKGIQVAPLRKIDDILIFGIIIYSTKQLQKITKIFDKNIDVIFVDSEKKIPFNIGNKFRDNFKEKKNILSNEFVEFGNLTTVLKSTVKKIPILEFKPNDITVEHVWLMLRNHFKILSKKKIAIIGAGNIGFKLAFKLVESGVTVNLYRRNFEKCTYMTNIINIIKPVSTLAEAIFSNSPARACYGVDAIIGCANEKGVIKSEFLKLMKPGGILIDVGKGNINKKAIDYAKNKKINLLRCDITETLNSFIKHNLEYFLKKKILYKKISSNISVICGGYIGKNGSIIVDNCNKPNQVLGVADGAGNFKRSLTNLDKIKITQLKKIYNII